MRNKGIVLVVLGILGAAFIFSFDVLAGKAENDITGPKSLVGLILCVVIVVVGLSSVLQGSKKARAGK